ncbi:arginine-tRNA-protein transferase [Annulohypoxylon maeteangense]|uniref:arginine-tRNA-protein transferase n=1 Tax=Annulohypoxylon maeteangense TaxID=1927788 RepID=UPI002007E7C1|nr:arginine-tRNA-protein transferase [Annulohypoxylon maeteangense]KAI0885303.1 arginine-tRNA-protein transferase [Annulohypoxylon maeteangense]
MQAPLEDAFLYISPIGYRKSSSCGYCRRKGLGHSYYARATSMSPASYQALVDRCWRRSGSLLYRPNQRDACCPHYTIRLDCGPFRPTKDQRQAVNRFNRYIIGDVYAKEAARLYPKSREQARKRDTEFDLVERIHEAERSLLKEPPAPSHTFTVTLEADDFTEEKFLVFENYQKVIHRESLPSISREGFKRFLCSSPIKQEKYTAPDGRERQLGSFHQCYRIDGKLVAIGVLDLLPDCVSTVYFLYHESIHKFSPGKLGALREIALAMEGGYRWWYPGFYIHTCPKMRYKIDFSPQQILDPDTLGWVGLTGDIIKKFDDHGLLHFQSAEEGITKTDSTTDEEAMQLEVGEGEGEIITEDGSDSDEDKPLFNSNMPGIPPIEDMKQVDLDHVVVRVNRGYCYAGDLFDWHNESISSEGSAKALVAELVAAVGPGLVHDICLDFKKS